WLRLVSSTTAFRPALPLSLESRDGKPPSDASRKGRAPRSLYPHSGSCAAPAPPAACQDAFARRGAGRERGLAGQQECRGPDACRWVTSPRRFDDCGLPSDNRTVMERGEVVGWRDAMPPVRL